MLKSVKSGRHGGRRCDMARRRLRIECLEPRLVLDGLPPDFAMALPLLYEPGRVDNLIVPIEYIGPTDPDAEVQLEVSVSSSFDSFLKSSGTIPLEDFKQTGYLPPLKNGNRAFLGFAAKSLEDIYGLLPGSTTLDVRSLTGDVIYSAVIQVQARYLSPTLQYSTVQTYSVHRFVSAVFPGTNIVDFGHLEPGEVHVNPIETGVPVPGSGSPYLSMDAPGMFFVADSRVVFRPQLQPQKGIQPIEAETINVATPFPNPPERKFIGTLEATGSVIAPRTWWLNKDTLAKQLRTAWPSGGEIPNFDAIAERIAIHVDQFMAKLGSNHAIRVNTPEAATITVDFPSYSGPTGEVFGVTPMNGVLAAQLRMRDIIDSYYGDNGKMITLNVPQRDYYVRQVLAALSQNAQYAWTPEQAGHPAAIAPTTTPIVIDITSISAHFQDPFERVALMENLITRTIAHELGHAHGFVHHIKDSQSPLDLMMSNGGALDEVGVNESKQMFSALLGNDWTSNDIDALLQRIRNAPASRSHDFFTEDEKLPANRRPSNTNVIEPLDVNSDGLISSLDVLLIVNDLNAHGSRVLPDWKPGQPGPFVDVNSDGAVTPLDVLLVVNELNRNASHSQGGSAVVVPLGLSLPKATATVGAQFTSIACSTQSVSVVSSGPIFAAAPNIHDSVLVSDGGLGQLTRYVTAFDRPGHHRRIRLSVTPTINNMEIVELALDDGSEQA